MAKQTTSTFKKCNLTFAADASSLLLLTQIDQLTAAEFFVPHSIWQELHGGRFADRIHPHIQIIDASPPPDVSLSQNDSELVYLYHRHHLDAILSDDGAVLRYCRRHNIPHFCALSFIAKLAALGCIGLARAQKDMTKLKNIGRYAPWVIDVADSIFPLAGE